MLAPITALQLREYGTSVNLAMTGDSELKTFLTGLAIIAARQITCFRKSDNYAWIKPGGLYENWDLRQCLFDALEVWMTYALNLHITDCHIGVLETRVNDIRYSRPLPEFRSVDAVVCSPPYANRLDYSRMWLPELAVYSELFGADIDAVRSMQIGTPIVRGRKSEVAVFSSIARECLDRIKNGDGKASDQYYYPFFQNYTVELEAGLENAGECLSSGGSCVVFVRDTVRKDEIFPTGKIVEELFVRKLGFSLLSCERKVIRHHIGMRRGVSSSLYGLGQQEWWLEFRKN
ncbi:MAG TPA: hypothetical protein VK171_00010 [Fimbriimonas sp.]|nr:hypothetical protein [Fimbriimonas sp.]